MGKISVCFLAVTLLLFGVSGAQGQLYTADLADYGKGDIEVLDDGSWLKVADDGDQPWQSSGSGVWRPYLSIQKNGFEHGFNTNAKPEPLDAKRGANPDPTLPDGYCHSIQVSDLYQVGDYYEFWVDINEPDNQNSLITLRDLEIYLVPSGAGGAIDNLATVQSSGTLVYDLDNAKTASGYTDVDALLDYSFWNGSGQNIDLFVYVPTALVSGPSDQYVYTYWAFGQASPGEPSDSGYEEIGVRPIPEPATMLLLGSGLIGLAGLGRKKFRKG